VGDLSFFSSFSFSVFWSDFFSADSAGEELLAAEGSAAACAVLSAAEASRPDWLFFASAEVF
jgi:hypothetical protein